jgi:CHAD domain-containing protein
LSKQLGPARDMDVWMRALKSMRAPDSNQWREFVGRQREIQKRKKESLRRILTDPSYRSLKADFEQFLDRSTVGTADVTLAELGARAVRKSLDRVADRWPLGPSFSARRAHLLRIACRKARYLAEFFTATLDRPAGRLARRLKAAQNVLGDIHDCDICLAHLRRASTLPPPGLVAELNRRRRAHVLRFGEVWDPLNIEEARRRS